MKILDQKVSKIIISFALVLVTVFSFLNVSTFAASPVPAKPSDCYPVPTNDPTAPYYLNGKTDQPCIQVTNSALGFRIPSLTEILTFAIRAVFVFGGLAALFFLLLGAFSWITSGGDKEKVSAAQQKIQAAVIGVIMIAVVLAIVVTLEQIIFGGKICLGLSCPLSLPTLVK